VSLQDDARYALDGLQPSCSISTQRDSAVTLTELLATRRGRMALRYMEGPTLDVQGSGSLGLPWASLISVPFGKVTGESLSVWWEAATNCQKGSAGHAAAMLWVI
jgi:hypothetical protein